MLLCYRSPEVKYTINYKLIVLMNMCAVIPNTDVSKSNYRTTKDR
jgi:hypothetical protein